MKRTYEKPSCTVLMIEMDSHLLAGSQKPGGTITTPGAGGGLGVDDETTAYDYWTHTNLNH